MTYDIYPLTVSPYESELDELEARIEAATAGLAEILADLITTEENA